MAERGGAGGAGRRPGAARGVRSPVGRASDVPSPERRRDRMGSSSHLVNRGMKLQETRDRGDRPHAATASARGAADRAAGVPAAVEHVVVPVGARVALHARVHRGPRRPGARGLRGPDDDARRRSRHDHRRRSRVAREQDRHPLAARGSPARRSRAARRASRWKCASPTTPRRTSTGSSGSCPVGVRKNYYQEVNEDAIVMWAHDVDRRRTRSCSIRSSESRPRPRGGPARLMLSSGSRRRATRPRPRSSRTATPCARRWCRARSTCTRASAGSCPRSRAAPTSS